MRLPETDGHVHLRITGLRHSEDSFEVRLFFGDPPPGARKDHDRFVGSFFMYGLGHPQAGERPPETAPWDLTVAVPAATLRAARASGAESLSFALVDASGNPLPEARLAFDQVVLER